MEEGVTWSLEKLRDAAGDFPFLPTGPCPILDIRYAACVAAGYLPESCEHQFPWTDLAEKCLPLQMLATCDLFPVECTVVLGLAKVANEAADYYYPDRVEGRVSHPGDPGLFDRGDFFEHCLWNGLVTVALNANMAELFTTRYEARADNPQSERQFDMASNERGRIYGSAVKYLGPAATPALIAACRTG